MCSKDKRMCTETVYNNGWYEDDDDDCLDDLIPDILECPVESLDEDSLAEDWESKLGPIPSEVFPEMLPPGGISNVGGVGGVPDHLAERGVSGPSVKAGEAKVQLQQPQKLSQGKKLYLIPKPFQELSPDSVLEHRTSASASSWEPVTFMFEKAAPQRTRTKPSRSRSTTNSWLNSLQQLPIPKTIIGKHDANGVKKCSHCEITKTPQWREGPMGPKTLCNACGVRYRSGRLFPEYRPAASPTFIPALHSNCHRKVVELRKKAADIDYY